MVQVFEFLFTHTLQRTLDDCSYLSRTILLFFRSMSQRSRSLWPQIQHIDMLTKFGYVCILSDGQGGVKVHWSLLLKVLSFKWFCKVMFLGNQSIYVLLWYYMYYILKSAQYLYINSWTTLDTNVSVRDINQFITTLNKDKKCHFLKRVIIFELYPMAIDLLLTLL